MTRRSTLKRRRERQRRRFLQRKKARQFLPSRPSTAKLLELVAQQSSVLADVIRELEQQQ